MDTVWRSLLIKFQYGWNSLIFYIKDNPVYAVVVFLFIIFLLWVILKPEINHR
jgi:hypothetical protein